MLADKTAAYVSAVEKTVRYYGEGELAVIQRALEVGALDAWMTPVVGKKGRPALCFTLLAAPSPDPHYPKVDNAPQFRAPGVVDPARGERDAVAAQLEEERAKLEALRTQAGSAGVTIAKAPNEAPTPTR